MDEILRQQLHATIQVFGEAHIMSLAAADAAVTRGQFNLAKVLRATAHSQRVMALNMAQLLASGRDPAQMLAEDTGDLRLAGALSAQAAVAPVLGRTTCGPAIEGPVPFRSRRAPGARLPQVGKLAGTRCSAARLRRSV